jgi:hypothetical protein
MKKQMFLFQKKNLFCYYPIFSSILKYLIFFFSLQKGASRRLFNFRKHSNDFQQFKNLFAYRSKYLSNRVAKKTFAVSRKRGDAKPIRLEIREPARIISAFW